MVNVRRVLHLYANARLRCAGSQQLQFRARICCPPARSSQRSNTHGHALKRPKQHWGLPLSCSNRGRRHGKCCSLLSKAASGAASPVPKERHGESAATDSAHVRATHTHTRSQPASHRFSPTHTASLHNQHSHLQLPRSMLRHQINTGTSTVTTSSNLMRDNVRRGGARHVQLAAAAPA